MALNLTDRVSPTAGLPGAVFDRDGGAHDPGDLTELSTCAGIPGGLYGSFDHEGGHNPGPLTELSSNAGIPGGIQGPFTHDVEPEPEPEPEPQPAHAFGGQPRRVPERQYARIRPWASPDAYSTLFARPGRVRALLRTFFEPDQYRRIQALPGTAHARLMASHDDTDEYSALIAARGLPDMTIAAFILSALWKRH